MQKSISTTYFVLLVLLATLLSPKGHAMDIETPMEEPQSHCAEMMSEMSMNDSSETHHKNAMECCGEGDCSMSACSGFLSLASTELAPSPSSLDNSFSVVSTIYFDPIQNFFKPPKVV